MAWHRWRGKRACAADARVATLCVWQVKRFENTELDRLKQLEGISNEREEEIQMLVEGMQRLDWGAIRLIDVDMAPGPLELSVAPLLSDSTLLCCRLEVALPVLHGRQRWLHSSRRWLQRHSREPNAT